MAIKNAIREVACIIHWPVSNSQLAYNTCFLLQICLNGGADNGGSEEVSAQFLLTRLVDNDYSDRSTSEASIGYNACRKEVEIFSLGGQSEVDVGLCTDEAAPVLDRNSLYPYLRVLAALAPVTHATRSSFLAIKDLTSKYLSQSTEDHVLSSLNLFTEGKLTGKYGSNFLSLVGFPSFSNSNVPSPARHPNISPVLGIIKALDCNYLLCPKAPFTLQNILQYSPEALKSDWQIRFLVYQILSPLVYMHGLGIAHGNLCPSSILLNDSCWAWLSITDMHLLRDNFRLKEPNSSSSKVYCCEDDCPCHSLFAELKLSSSIDWHSDFMRWWKGELSNYEYLLVLNRLAGRRWGDHTFHTVMPWVIDFTVKPNENSDTGWRDLKKSKWRLAKGDEQLDFTYQTSEVPHHVSDECLSELAVCSYKARRLPLRILRSAVRSVYEPNEYPSNMQRLYQWTPDECIPEFYSDPDIFSSLHSEMNDLSIPSWAASPQEFISLHRDALESERVSQQIHHWIDITFGYKLSGEASITAKNVMLPVSDPSRVRSIGRRQLFTRPHPVRRGIIWHSSLSSHGEECTHRQEQGNTSRLNSPGSPHIGCLLRTRSEDIVLSDTRYLEDLEEAISFCEHARYLSPVYGNCEIFVENCPLNSQQTDYPNIRIPELIGSSSTIPSDLKSSLLEFFDANDNGSVGFQELLHWRQKFSSLGIDSEDLAEDIFSIGCILAEIYLKRPLFDPVSLAAYRESGTLPGSVQDLPPHVAILVKASIQKDWKRYPTTQCILSCRKKLVWS